MWFNWRVWALEITCVSSGFVTIRWVLPIHWWLKAKGCKLTETFTGVTLGAQVTILTLAQSVLKLKQGYSKDNSPSCNLVTTRKWHVCLSCIVGPTELMPPWFLTGPRPNSKFPIQPCLRPETTDQACLHRARGYLVLWPRFTHTHTKYTRMQKVVS